MKNIFLFFYLALVAIWITFWITGQTRVKSHGTNLRELSIGKSGFRSQNLDFRSHTKSETDFVTDHITVFTNKRRPRLTAASGTKKLISAAPLMLSVS